MKKLLISAALMALILPMQSQAQGIDGTSDESFEQSIATMVASLSEEDSERFSKGFISLALHRYPPAHGASEFAKILFAESAIKAAPRTMDGVSLAEILAEADRIDDSRLNHEEAQAEASLARERVRRAEAEAAEAARAEAEARAAALEMEQELERVQ